MVFNLHCYRHVVQRSAYLAWGICRKEDVSEPQAVQLNSISQKAHLLGKITSTPDDQHVLALSPPTSTPSYQPFFLLPHSNQTFCKVRARPLITSNALSTDDADCVKSF